MQYPARLSDDLKYLSAYYKWTDEDKKEVRIAFTGSPEMVRYFITLASAHRAGYIQGAANGHQRLKDWCIERGLDDPYLPCFDVKELDFMAVQDRQMLR